MVILIGWWIIVIILGMWVISVAWGVSTYKEKFIHTLVVLGFAFIIPLIAVKITPFAQWFLHIIGA